MENMIFNRDRSSQFNLLCLGSHCDDLEIGCGGTILRLIKEFQNIEINWIVFSSGEERSIEAENSAKKITAEAKKKKISILDFRDGYFPYIGTKIKDHFESMKREIHPDLIFTHFGQDFHQDHRLISELTWNTFRDHFILEYEIPKYDGDLGRPNFFVHLSEEYLRRKNNVLMECFPSQRSKTWFKEETFTSLARLRGLESNSPSGYAEGFFARKVFY